MRKKVASMLTALCVSASLLSGLTLPVGAERNISVELNGKTIGFDQPPIIMNDRTLVPMRAIFEAMNCEVVWHDNLKQIIVWKDDEWVMGMQIGLNRMWFPDGHDTILDAAPIVINDRTLVPLRAITECLGATVSWDGGTKKVSIKYSQTIGNISTPQPTVRPTARPTAEPTEEPIEEPTEEPVDEPQVTAAPQRPSSNGVLSDYINGAFMYITLPAGKSIEVPNNSGGSLKITMEGIFSAMEKKTNGSITSQSYNAKDRKGSISISKGSTAIIQNSGSSDVIVSIPSEYAPYSETSEKVYEKISLNEGESVELSGMQQDGFAVSSREYNWIEINQKKNCLYKSAITGSTSPTLYKEFAIIMTATGNIDIFYCPATIQANRTSQNALNQVTVGSGQTVRIRAAETSQSVVYTDGEHTYDAVIYKDDGKVASQKQDKKNKSISLNKGNYVDFTNKSSETVILKIPSVYCSVE